VLKKDLVAACAQPIVLAILVRGESYGYAILAEVRRASREELAWSDGMLYPVLRRMEQRGLVRSRWVESDEGRRRRYYRITPAGRRSLGEEQEQWNLVNRTLEALWTPRTSS
jgi:PadR family transcriptional regulator, regulatory protein PadR